MRSSSLFMIASLPFFALLGCESTLGGEAGGSGSSPQVAGPDSPPVGSGGSEAGPDLEVIGEADPDTLVDGVPAQSRVPRLSYAQYDRSVSELLLTRVSPSDLFPAEQPNLGSYEDGGARGVNERLLREIVTAAEELSRDAVEDASRYATIVGCEPTEPTCRDDFIRSFGRRAYRRPLTAAELSRFGALFDEGAELIQSGDTFRDGVQMVIEAALQSAKFLYRAEQGDGRVDEVGALLSDFEVATRLSYLFLGAGPDDALLDAAASGGLSTPDGIREQVDRLAADPRVVDTVIDFHDRWLQLEGLGAAEKDPTTFPEFGSELVASMRAELHAVVEEITLNRSGGIVELLTTPLVAPDAELARVYGLAGSFGDDATVVELPMDSGRSGVLTHAAFLTGHSSASTRTSPILRGVFVLDRFLCQEVPPPPPGAEMEEPDTPPEADVLTTRDYFSWKTSMAACATCHSHINPVGFAFENFDGIGAYRDTDNGLPVDASGSLDLSETSLSFEGAAEFSRAISEIPRVRACYAKNWLNYVYGRHETAGDARTLGRIASALGEGAHGARDLLTLLTTGAAFNHLPPIQN